MDKNIIIADLDGTIALIEHRRHFVKGKHQDWDAFYAACVEDEPNHPVIHTIFAMHLSGFIINIFSGRDDAVRGHTVEWLKRWNVPYNSLLMRPHGDYTPDEVLKREWLYKNPELKDKVLFVLDDRQKVVDMWRSEGLTCFQVAEGGF